MATKVSKEVKLSVQNLTKKYDNEQRNALDNLSFDVYDGEFLSILGPSGCGKSTIIKILIGLTPPTSGQIVKDGQDITNAKISKRGMGIVFQNYALFENMTVRQNIEFALKLNKETKKLAGQIADELMEKLNLTEFANKKPANLSGGQQQRVAIARTLAMKPDIILFDEPMSALDASTRLELCSEIKRVQKEFNTTIIYITHDQEEAFSLSDRIMVMSTAEIRQIGAPKDILAKPVDDYVKSFVCDNLELKVKSLNNILGKKNESKKR